MIQIPQLKSQWAPHVIAGQGVMLLSERENRVLRGRGYEQVLPLIDGKRSAQDIVMCLAAVMTAPETYLVLLRLEEAGYITESTPDANPHQNAFWNMLGEAPGQAEARLASTCIVLVCNGDMPASTQVQLALSQAGLTVIAIRDMNNVFSTATHFTQDVASHLYVVLTADYLDAKLLDFSAHARANGVRWMPVRINGGQSWMGPVYDPRQTTCHACTVNRLTFNQLAHRFLQTNHSAAGPIASTAVASLPATINLAAAWLAMELVRCRGKGQWNAPAQLVSLDHLTGECARHTVLADPHCPVCGSAIDVTHPVRIALSAQTPVVHTDGGHRTVAPEVTVQKFLHLVSPITGMINRLLEVSAPGSVSHVFVAGHNRALGMQNLAQLRKGMRWASAGKGRSRYQAMASAMCEAIERYSGEALNNDPRDVTLSYQDMLERMGPTNVIHPNGVMAYSEAQFRQRSAINALNAQFHFVPEPLPDDQPIAWSPIWSMSHECVKYLPTQLVRYPAIGNQAMFARGCSNGSASGNTLEEAILQGFCELVERDATAIWWYNRLRRPSINLSAFDNDDYFSRLRAEYASRNRDLWALDLTSDLGIPVVAALSKRIGLATESVLIGLGCHLDMRIAVDRAFAELNQMYWMSLPDPETDLPGIGDKHALNWFSTATTENQPYLLPNTDLPPTRIDVVNRLGNNDLVANITQCRHIIESKGMEMLVLDLTRDDIGLPVVKVVVPGLRHFWCRLGPGRLYDVPVQMGWLSTAHTEDELNPIPIFF